MLLYWQIGRQINERQEREGWGAKVIDRLAADLGREFPGVEGFGARNLRNMKHSERMAGRFNCATACCQITMGHNIQILRVAAGPEREWYAHSAIEYGWSRAVLVHQIETKLFQRQGKSETNFTRTLPPEQSDMAQQILKDPYHFDFLTLGPSSRERALERGLLNHLKDLLLELGRGFAFLGNQYKIEVDERPYYIDLLFYHAHLHCYVVIDLKVREFEPEYAGKMTFTCQRLTSYCVATACLFMSSSPMKLAILCGRSLTRIRDTSSGRVTVIRAAQRRRFSGRTGNSSS